MADASPLLTALDDLLQACEQEDWDRADGIVKQHDAQVRLALVSRDPQVIAELHRVCTAQQSVLGELGRRRDEAARQLGALQRSGQAARAYLASEQVGDSV